MFMILLIELIPVAVLINPEDFILILWSSPNDILVYEYFLVGKF